MSARRPPFGSRQYLPPGRSGDALGYQDIAGVGGVVLATACARLGLETLAMTVDHFASASWPIDKLYEHVVSYWCSTLVAGTDLGDWQHLLVSRRSPTLALGKGPPTNVRAIVRRAAVHVCNDARRLRAAGHVPIR